MVLPRIGLILLCFVLVSGFTSPTLPSSSRGVYRFGSQNLGGSVFRTLSGGLFSLTIGFKHDALKRRSAHTHREHAQELLDAIAASLQNYDEVKNHVEISVSRVYPTIREVMLTVSVRNASNTDKVRAELTTLLSAAPGIAFAGDSGKVSVE